MLSVHTEQSELFVCIYIQELSIHVYKRVYILLRDGRFPMPCPCKRVCTSLAAQKRTLRFLQCTLAKIALLTLAVPKTRQHLWGTFSDFPWQTAQWIQMQPPPAPVPVGGQRVSRDGPTKTQWNNLGINFAKFLFMTGFTCRQYCCLHGYRMHMHCGDVWEHFHNGTKDLWCVQWL